jgi:hypothetical protein
VRTADGTVEIQRSAARPAGRTPMSPMSPISRSGLRGRRDSREQRNNHREHREHRDHREYREPPWEREPREEREAPEPDPAAARPPRGKTVRIFPYAVSKSKLERAIRKLRVPAYLIEDLDEADMVVTLKAQERRQPRRLRDAQARGVPVYVVKSNTIVQAENFLRAVFDVGDVAAGDEAALQEAEAGIDEVLDHGHPVELPPRNNYLRRLQHQVVERYGLTSESKGEEPYRRVVIYPDNRS